MILYLAGGETWWRYFDRYGIRNVLLSYHYLRGQTDFSEMVTWMENAKKADEPRRFFLDSGAFTYMHGGHDTLEDLNEYADEYVRFLNTDPAAKLFDVVAELDVYQRMGDEEDDDVYKRVNRHREMIYEAVGDRILPTYQVDWLDLKDWDRICADPRYKQVAIGSSGESGSAGFISLHKRLIAVAHKHGKAIHGFGQTRLQTDMKYLRNYDSVDSTTWLRADKYGGTFIFQNGHLRILNHEQKHQRAWFKGYFKRIGLDPERILGTHKEHADNCPGPNSQTKGCEACKDQLEELRASSIIAWRELSKRYERMGQRLSSKRQRCPSNEHENGGFTVKPTGYLRKKKGWKGPPGTKPLYEDFGGFKCRSYRRRPRSVDASMACRACPNLSVCQKVEHAERLALAQRQAQQGVETETPLLPGDHTTPTTHEPARGLDTAPVASAPGPDLLEDPPAAGGEATGAEEEVTHDPDHTSRGREEVRPGRDHRGRVQGGEADRLRSEAGDRGSAESHGQMAGAEHQRHERPRPNRGTGATARTTAGLTSDTNTSAHNSHEHTPRAKQGSSTPNSPATTAEEPSTHEQDSPHSPSAPPEAPSGFEDSSRIPGATPESPGSEQDSRHELGAPPEPPGSGQDSSRIPGQDPESPTQSPAPGQQRPGDLVPLQDLRRRDSRELITRGGLNLGAWRRDLPRVECDVCNLADECPQYRASSVCAYNEVFDQFDTRNSDDVLALQQALVEVDKDRTMMAILQERLTTGGQIDPRVTQQMNSFQNRIQVLDQMQQARNTPTPTGFNVRVDMPAPSDPTAQRSPGVLTMLFGGGGGISPSESAGEAHTSPDTKGRGEGAPHGEHPGESKGGVSPKVIDTTAIGVE